MVAMMKLVRGLLVILVFGAKAPWICAAGVVSGVRALGRGVRLLVRGARSSSVLRCPAGHPNPLLGRWRCACAFEMAGHAFAPCPSCHEEAGWFPCRTCGLGIQDPLQK